MTSEDALEQAEEQLAARSLLAALDSFHAAEQLGAEPNRCSAGLWQCHMLLGDFESAWCESDAIFARTPEDPQRFWRAESLNGKRVILRCLHGYGDSVQFLRFLPELQRRAHRVILEVPPRFVELAELFDGADEVVTWGERAPAQPPEWDVQIEVNELAYLLRLTTAQLPWRERYLHIPAALKIGATESVSSSRLNVGIVWSSGSWNPQRSLEFEHLSPILQVPGCDFWNLQGGETRAQWPQTGSSELHDATECADSMVSLTALIARLDLVISTDTLAVHLAGALGVPCWVMLQFAADWRWMQHRADTPWYPSVTLFRRQQTEPWLALTERVAQQLAKHTKSGMRNKA